MNSFKDYIVELPINFLNLKNLNLHFQSKSSKVFTKEQEEYLYI